MMTKCECSRISVTFTTICPPTSQRQAVESYLFFLVDRMQSFFFYQEHHHINAIMMHIILIVKKCLTYKQHLKLSCWHSSFDGSEFCKSWHTWCQLYLQELKDLIKRMLVQNPNRLGSGEGGASAIKQHPWFHNFDWDAFAERKLIAPHVPKALPLSFSIVLLISPHLASPYLTSPHVTIHHDMRKSTQRGSAKGSYGIMESSRKDHSTSPSFLLSIVYVSRQHARISMEPFVGSSLGRLWPYKNTTPEGHNMA